MSRDEIRMTGKGYFSDSGVFGGTEALMRLDFQRHSKETFILRLLDAKGYSENHKDAPAESGIYLTKTDARNIVNWLEEWLKQED